ncbi:hypothetical protein ACHQM5_023593 [Ranunculus cassubicifolius]
MTSESANHLRNPTNIVAVPSQYVGMAEKFEKKEKSWVPTSEIPTDLIIKVQDINFCVHKLPLLSRSEYLSQLDLQSHNSNFSYDIKLDNFPGGVEIFEIILKFCYGFPVNLTSANVAPLRCASEFLQMTEEYEEGNLVSKTEAFLTFIVLSSWRDSITVLKSCEDLSPWAENLHIVRRCSDSIASKIIRRTSVCGGADDNEKWWFDDVSILRTDHFARIITMIRAKGSRPDIIGECIMHYAEKWLPSMEEDEKGYGCGKNELHMSILNGRRDDGGVGKNKEQRIMIEVLLSILPAQKEAVSCKFLLWMLKMAIIFSVTPALVSDLETKIGMVLQDATVNDLLIPNYNHGAEGGPAYEETPTHDVDAVQRIVEYYLIHDQQQQHEQISGKLDVGKLLDGYLAEVATDPNLSIIKFQALAESLPKNARTCHDGLYRAIDTYLKTHPTLREHDRRRLCKVMDSEKLSLDACTHAAQNDRLPLRTVMQVLFSEQVKMRGAMKEKEQKQSEIKEEDDSRSLTKREIKNIILELEKIRLTISELQHGYSELQRDLEKINKPNNTASGWTSGWKKFKNLTFFHSKHNESDSQVQPEQTPDSTKNGRKRRQSYS